MRTEPFQSRWRGGAGEGQVELIVVKCTPFLPGFVPLGRGPAGKPWINFPGIGNAEIVGQRRRWPMISQPSTGEHKHTVVEFEAVETMRHIDHTASWMPGKIMQQEHDFGRTAWIEAGGHFISQKE